MKRLLIVIFLSIFLFIPIVKATDVTDCIVINNPDTYYVTNDIMNSSISSCIEIQTNNVYLNCNGHSISATDINLNAIFLNSANNIVIENCVIHDIGNGLILSETTNLTFINNSVYNTEHGITFYDSHNCIIYNNNFTSNGIGFWFLYATSSYNNVTYNRFIDNGFDFTSFNTNPIDNMFYNNYFNRNANSNGSTKPDN
jgi:parallel beta-helix repeat protein